MTDGPHLLEKFGAATFPSRTPEELDASDGLLRNPGQDMLLALFRTAINAELGDDWTTVTNTLPVGHRLRSTSPVEVARPGEPLKPYVLEQKAKLPALFLHPEGDAEFSMLTQYISQQVQNWELHWILGPMDVADSRKLSAFADKVGKLIHRVCVGKGHPAYLSGAVQWNDGTSDSTHDFVRVVARKRGFGQASFAGTDDPPFHTLLVTIETTELSEPTDDADVVCSGADGTLDVGDGQALQDDMIELEFS